MGSSVDGANAPAYNPENAALFLRRLAGSEEEAAARPVESEANGTCSTGDAERLAEDLAAVHQAGWSLQQLLDLLECEELGIPVAWPQRLNGVVAARVVASGFGAPSASEADWG